MMKNKLPVPRGLFNKEHDQIRPSILYQIRPSILYSPISLLEPKVETYL
jgi:hypothetical protein